MADMNDRPETPLQASTSTAAPMSPDARSIASTGSGGRDITGRKPCPFYARNMCRFGDKCWNSHDLGLVQGGEAGSASLSAEAGTSAELAEDGLECSICLEHPTLFGLLENCAHIFCYTCITRWRSLEGKSNEQILSGSLSACPICRTPATFVCQSSVFHPTGQAKTFAIAQMRYKLSMIDCKHFKATNLSARSCPFGSDCLYRHRLPDGTLHQLPYTRQQYLETAHRPRTMEEEVLLDLLMQAASGRDASEILRRMTGARGPGRASLTDFIANLRDMGLAQDAGSEDEWEDENDFDEDDDEGESDTNMPPLEYIADSDDEGPPAPRAQPAASARRAAPATARSATAAPRRVDSSDSLPPLEDVVSSDEDDAMPPLEDIESSDDEVHEADDSDDDSMPPLDMVESDDDELESARSRTDRLLPSLADVD